MRRLFLDLFDRVKRIYRHIPIVLVITSPIWVAVLMFPVILFLLPGPHDTARIVQLESGRTLPLISSRLKARGVLHSGTIFRSGARLFGVTRHLKAGEYRFDARANMWTIIRKLMRGDVLLHKIKIVEGMSSYQIVADLNTNPLFTGEIGFMPEEGSLLPETYYVPRGIARSEIIANMQTAMTMVLDALWETRTPGLPLNTPREALILASIVEKETGRPTERGLISSVFLNRLRAQMRLQSDPTVIYGITLGRRVLGRELAERDLDHPSTYNTYIIRGLPPRPISNPGRASIAAVLSPPPFKALYFVVDGKGGHVFANTLADHNRNVGRWRRSRGR